MVIPSTRSCTMLSFYGSKWRAAPLYPQPTHGAIIEPFAGGAGYSLNYPHLEVTLVERDPQIAATWRYLIGARPAEIMAIPLIRHGQHPDELDTTPEGRLLVRWWLQYAVSAPRNTLTQAARVNPNWASYWGARRRSMIAANVEKIRHWVLIEGDYSAAPDINATWFIDPPYQDKGRHYVHSSVDYLALAQWARARTGRVMVCENVGAAWLPFRPLAEIKSARGKSSEVIWNNDTAKPAPSLDSHDSI